MLVRWQRDAAQNSSSGPFDEAHARDELEREAAAAAGHETDIGALVGEAAANDLSSLSSRLVNSVRPSAACAVSSFHSTLAGRPRIRYSSSTSTHSSAVEGDLTRRPRRRGVSGVGPGAAARLVVSRIAGFAQHGVLHGDRQVGAEQFDGGLVVFVEAVRRFAFDAQHAHQTPIEPLLREENRFQTLVLDYRDGLRCPRLERMAGSEDRLAGTLGRR